MTDNLLALAYLHKYFFDQCRYNPTYDKQEAIDTLDRLIKGELKHVKACLGP